MAAPLVMQTMKTEPQTGHAHVEHANTPGHAHAEHASTPGHALAASGHNIRDGTKEEPGETPLKTKRRQKVQNPRRGSLSSKSSRASSSDEESSLTRPQKSRNRRAKRVRKCQDDSTPPPVILLDDQQSLSCKTCGASIHDQSPLPPQPQHGGYFPWNDYHKETCPKTHKILKRWPKADVCSFCRNTYNGSGYRMRFNKTLSEYTKAILQPGSDCNKIHPEFTNMRNK